MRRVGQFVAVVILVVAALGSHFSYASDVGLVSLCERLEREPVILRSGLVVNGTHQTCDQIRAIDPRRIQYLEVTYMPKNGLQCDALSELVNLRSLVLRYSLDRLSRCQFNGLNKLRTLAVQGGSIGPIAEDVFAGLPGLEWLELTGIEISVLSRDHFRSLRNLGHLDISRNRLTHLPEDLFADLTHLKVLFMYDNPLIRIPERLFYPLREITFISMGSNTLQHIPDFSFVNQWKLVTLDLTDAPLKSTRKAAFYGVGFGVIRSITPEFENDPGEGEWKH